jgi:hypothetical protein
MRDSDGTVKLARVCEGCYDRHNNPTASGAFRSSTLEELARNKLLVAKGGLERTSSGGVFRESEAHARAAEAARALAASCPHALNHINVVECKYEKSRKKYSWSFQVYPEFCEIQTLKKRFSEVKTFHNQLLSELRKKKVRAEYHFNGTLPVEPWGTVNDAFLKRRQSEFVAYWQDFVLWEQSSRSHALEFDTKSLGGKEVGAASGAVMSLETVAEFFETTKWLSKVDAE